MKRILIPILLIFSLLVTLAGCKKKEEETKIPTQTVPTSSSSTKQAESKTVVQSKPTHEAASSESYEQSNYDGHSIIGTWCSDSGIGGGVPILEWTFYEDWTVVKKSYVEADRDYPENHKERMSTYELTTYRGEDALLFSNSSKTNYWIIEQDEKGTDVLTFWVADDDFSKENPSIFKRIN